MFETKKVSFKNRRLNLAGQLYLPENFNATKKCPALVLAHPEGAVKEQVPATYAEKLVGYGYVCLIFDGAFMGESDGEPHFTTDPFQRVEDIQAAVDFLTTLDYVDHERIGGLGICAGGAYMIDAAKTEKRFKAIGSVVPVDMGQGMREFQASKAELIKTLRASADQRTAEVNGTDVLLTEMVAESDEAAQQFPEHSLFREACSYYRGVKEHPRSTGQQVFSQFDKLLRYSAFEMMEEFWSHPLLVITGTLADTRPFAEEAVSLSDGLGRLYVIDGATHVDLYYKDQYVDQAIQELVAFFGENLWLIFL